MPGLLAINNSNNNIFTTIGAINKRANGFVLLMKSMIPKTISIAFTTVKNPVEYKIPAKVPALPGSDGGIGIKCKKKFEPKITNINASKYVGIKLTYFIILIYACLIN